MAERESEELEAMMRRMYRALVRRAASGDTTALEALARLERVGSAATTVALWRSHRSSRGLYSLGELADVVGATRQAVQQRIRRVGAIPSETRAWLSH